MGDKICMNELCKTETTLQWKKGWGLKSGGFATLCYNCGSAYENSLYCETFHIEESGWRECKNCGKHIHCGCIASKSLHDFLDFGGIKCISCANGLQTHPMRPIQISNDIPNGFGTLTLNNLTVLQSSILGNIIDGMCVDNGKVVQSSKNKEENKLVHFPQTQNNEASTSMRQDNRLNIIRPIGEAVTGFPDLMQQPVGLSMFSSSDTCMQRQGVKDTYESVAQPSLMFSLSTPLSQLNSAVPFPGEVAEEREQSKVLPFQQGQRTRYILPKPCQSGLTLGADSNKGMVSQMRVARPPAEGRGRVQLLPRYWPRITDQELQKLSGDLNSNIEPLFEKVLSASDAGRIGRLVLPKACAEEFFPPINQSEGLPLRIQDVKGKEWTFQFRFWPNNNSRMYVLEGVTPCIQNMDLEAGDTVTFSRRVPGGELVMGFRKASNSDVMQVDQTFVLPNGAVSGEMSLFNVNENLPTHVDRKNENPVQQPMLIPEKKTRNIGSKSKRLLMHSEDAVELRVTWGESQELLRSPPCEPTIFMVEDQAIEEYDDPPVFGKRTIFRVQPSGEQEQWAQCDSCFKWRKLPVDVLLPPKWTCSDNSWDLCRSFCSAPDQMSPEEIESLFRVGKDLKKRRLRESHQVAQECEPSGLDALATAAVLGDNAGDSGEPSVGVTTRHPRHRPGCSCIVCIQPPSGKGKHKPTCICNVCISMKRRFKTLMLRKKKRQSEREAGIAQGSVQDLPKDESEMGGTPAHAQPQMDCSDNERSQSRIPTELGETSKDQLDLNYHPNREEDQSMETTGHEASFPMQMCLRQNGLTGFLGTSLPSQTAGGRDDNAPEEETLASILLELENKG